MGTKIKSCCYNLLSIYDDSVSRDDLFRNCAIERLSTIYENDNVLLDKTLERIERTLDLDDISQVKPLLKNLNHIIKINRNQLITLLGRIDING